MLLEPRIVSAEAIATELGEQARGFALDRQLSARSDLGWKPMHLDPEGEIARPP